MVSNKETNIANYLQHRSILEVTEEHRSLVELNPEKLDIVDVDKFLYIYYPTDDGDLSFRSDMNNLRTLLSSAFFHVSEGIFILVDSSNPLLEDLIYSALRNSALSRERIEIIHHTGSLMLPDVGKYLSGNASGQTTSSSYKDVYIREADKEEKERYVNTVGGLETVLPVLTDMSALYAQRAGVEAISAGRLVNEPAARPQVVQDFTRVSVSAAKTISSFVISGEDWTDYERAIGYILEYNQTSGRRCLVINLDPAVDLSMITDKISTLSLLDIKSPVTPEQTVAVVGGRFNQLGYIIQFLQNVHGVEQYIFNVCPVDYLLACQMIQQLSEQVYMVFVAHYNYKSVERYVRQGLKSTALFLSFEHFKTDFDLKRYKSELHGTIVAAFPTEDVDYVEFYNFATGGGSDE